MKFIFLLLTLVSLQSFAAQEANCELVNGIYQNSSTSLTELKFQTLVDIFTIKNANTLRMKLDNEDLKFIRSDLEVKRQTKLIFLLKENRKTVRAVHMMLDRTPKRIVEDREFYGNMIISQKIKDNMDYASILTSENLVYNFYCRF